MHHRPAAVLALAISLAALLPTSALAGPLSPPAGPVASTGKTLAQVEPRTPLSAETTPGDSFRTYKITQPGSYYLTGNMTAESGNGGILIDADNVTLDLSGFTVAAGPSPGVGITTSIGRTNITIRNGSVIGWADYGINLTNASNCRVQNITVRGISGANGAGIYAGAAAVIENCTATGCAATGIDGGGIATIRACIATSNAGVGIDAGHRSTIEACTASTNGQHGILVGNGSTAHACAASSNGGDGFYAVDNSQVLDCIATSNAGNGFRLSYAVQLARCNSVGNTIHGIRLGNNCMVLDSLCRANGLGASVAAGIYAPPGTVGARIEGNNCTENDTGLSVQGNYNIIVRNTCGANGLNFEIAANNRAGAVVVPPLTGVINGNAGGPGSGTIDPFANFAF